MAGTVEAFDRQAYKEALAGLLSGVSPEHISLSVSAGSVVVDATVTTPDPTSLRQTTQTLNSYDATTLSAALGVVVESVDPAAVTMVPVLPPPPSIQSRVPRPRVIVAPGGKLTIAPGSSLDIGSDDDA